MELTNIKLWDKLLTDAKTVLTNLKEWIGCDSIDFNVSDYVIAKTALKNLLKQYENGIRTEDLFFAIYELIKDNWA